MSEAEVIRQFALWVGGDRESLDVPMFLQYEFAFPSVPLYRGLLWREERGPIPDPVVLRSRNGLMSWTTDFGVAREFTRSRHGPAREGAPLIVQLVSEAAVVVPPSRLAPAWFKQGLRDHDEDAYGAWVAERECLLYADAFEATTR